VLAPVSHLALAPAFVFSSSLFLSLHLFIIFLLFVLFSLLLASRFFVVELSRADY